MKHFLLFLSIALVCVSCGNDDGPNTPTGPAERTVIVYMSAENNLSNPFADRDTSEMVIGSKALSKSYHYIAFVDKAEKDKKPSIWKFEDGQSKLIKEYPEDFYNSDPAKMKEILEFIAKEYPAKSYGLVLWGHATGWIIENDSVEYTRGGGVRRAYGRDTGNNSSRADNYGKWINIPTLAKMLKSLSYRFDYIFCDCCNMANAETAYELRDVTDYLIGSPGEIPGEGAPYDKLTTVFFSKQSSAYQDMINIYADDTQSCLPLSVIKLSEMEQLANATRVILQTLEPTAEKELNLDGLMYYDGVVVQNLRSLFDMNHFLLQNAAADDYRQWKQALDRAIVSKRFASSWMTNGHVRFSWFEADEQKYGGMSMYIPRTFYDNYDYSSNYNSTYHQMQWYWAVGWNNYGWN